MLTVTADGYSRRLSSCGTTYLMIYIGGNFVAYLVTSAHFVFLWLAGGVRVPVVGSERLVV